MPDPAIRRHGRRAGGAAGIGLRSLLWLLLGGWVGSWACFGLVVAPIAFDRLPSAEIAGRLIGPVLSALHVYGAVAGGALALLAGLMGRGRLRVALPVLMAAACVYTQFGVSAEIAEIRDQVFGPEGSEALAARFTELHRRSVGIFLAVAAGTLWLVVLHAGSDTRNAA